MSRGRVAQSVKDPWGRPSCAASRLRILWRHIPPQEATTIMKRPVSATIAALALAVAAPAMAQERGTPLAVGQMAPDFDLRGATRYGVLQDPVRLSEYRGKTVVLAFFFRARTRG